MVASRADRGFHFARTWSGRRSREVNARHLQRHPIRSRTQNNNTPKKGGERKRNTRTQEKITNTKNRGQCSNQILNQKKSLFLFVFQRWMDAVETKGGTCDGPIQEDGTDGASTRMFQQSTSRRR